MPNQMKLRIKSLKQYSCLLGCFSWVLVIFVGLEIQAFLFSANTSVKLVILLLIILSLVVVLFLEVWKKKQGPGEIYKIKISCTDRESLITSSNSIPICENANVIMLSKDKYKIRILLQFISIFDANILGKQRKVANRMINKQYRISSDLPMHDALKMLRINLVVCDEVSDSTYRWVERDTAHLLSRNESIVNAAIILNQGILLFPDCLPGPTYIEIKKYELAATILCSLFT